MVARASVTDTFFGDHGGTDLPIPVLEERLRLILEVRPRQRPLLPSFGCRVHELAAIETEQQRQLAAVLVEESLRDWAPWAGVRSVHLLAVDKERIRLRLTGRLPGLELSFRRAAGPGKVEGKG